MSHKEIKKLVTRATIQQAEGPRRAPRQGINNAPRTRPIQELVINRAIRMEKIVDPVIRKHNVAGNNMNF